MALPELTENHGSRLPTDYRIRYEHIRFGYNAEKTILNDINLDIKPNSLNAFAGAPAVVVKRHYSACYCVMLIRNQDELRSAVSIFGMLAKNSS